LFFTENEEARLKGILDDLALSDRRDVILIDARSDNKTSASNVA
jgi:hypothetical protein